MKCHILTCIVFGWCGLGLSHVLSLVLQELSLFYRRDVNGVGVLYNLLKSPWLQALLKVRSLLIYIYTFFCPLLPHSALSTPPA